MPGQSVTYTVALTALHGFSEPVTLDVSGLPTDATAAWLTNPLTPTADTTLTIDAASSTPTGTYTLFIGGTGGDQEHGVSVSLAVTQPPCPQTGLWSGVTNEGYPISYTVSYAGGCQVDAGLVIKYSTNCFIATSTLNWDIPIVDNHFDSNSTIPEVIGDFTSPTTAVGTWDYSGPWPFPPGWCSGSGTWTASHNP
jgi:hypothetical protein